MIFDWRRVGSVPASLQRTDAYGSAYSCALVEIECVNTCVRLRKSNESVSLPAFFWRAEWRIHRGLRTCDRLAVDNVCGVTLCGFDFRRRGPLMFLSVSTTPRGIPVGMMLTTSSSLFLCRMVAVLTVAGGAGRVERLPRFGFLLWWGSGLVCGCCLISQ